MPPLIRRSTCVWSLMWANASRSEVMMMQFQSLPLGPGGGGGVDVVGLEARGREGGQAEGVEQGAGALELLDQLGSFSARPAL